jgi:putative ribosome biogenesis GTPase RsgA
VELFQYEPQWAQSKVKTLCVLHALEITPIIYFNRHDLRRQNTKTPAVAVCTHYSQIQLNACAEKKQAGIIQISLLTADKRTIIPFGRLARQGRSLTRCPK